MLIDGETERLWPLRGLPMWVFIAHGVFALYAFSVYPVVYLCVSNGWPTDGVWWFYEPIAWLKEIS